MLKEEFKERMKSLLKEDYPKFIFEIENREAVKAVRFNRLKTENSKEENGAQAHTRAQHENDGTVINFEDEAKSPSAKHRIDGFELTEIGYSENSYIISGDGSIGNTPEHHSGMIYAQDPGAMATVNSVDIKEGAWVLDVCAAPGGKSGQAAEKIGESGFILSNEYQPKRAKILVSNFERLGIKNAMITSLDSAELGEMFSKVFDLVICDVPCSGEGMFRKTQEAADQWSPESVIQCQKRQEYILDNIKDTVKGGGYLLYSTCTYSLEENEEVVEKFLSENSDFHLTDVKNEVKKVTSDGINLPEFKTDMSKCRRFYPHISRGEGQFIALLKRDETSERGKILYKEKASEASAEEKRIIKSFFEENLITLPSGRIIKSKDNFVLISHGCPVYSNSVFSAGVLIGEIKHGILHPSHQFFSCYGNLFRRQEKLTRGDSRIYKYLHGEEIDSTLSEGGYCAVTYEGAVIGGGKAVGGKIKNHYPKGLRIN